MPSKPSTITDLRDQLLEAFTELRQDPRRINQAKELANVAGKVIGTLSKQLEYAMMRAEEPEIEFMGKTTGRALKSNAKLLLSDPKK